MFTSVCWHGQNHINRRYQGLETSAKVFFLIWKFQLSYNWYFYFPKFSVYLKNLFRTNMIVCFLENKNINQFTMWNSTKWYSSNRSITFFWTFQKICYQWNSDILTPLVSRGGLTRGGGQDLLCRDSPHKITLKPQKFSARRFAAGRISKCEPNKGRSRCKGGSRCRKSWWLVSNRFSIRPSPVTVYRVGPT